jgi:hypothetical protein
MKKVLFVLFLAFAAATTFSGCDKPEYKHPMQR